MKHVRQGNVYKLAENSWENAYIFGLAKKYKKNSVWAI